MSAYSSDHFYAGLPQQRHKTRLRKIRHKLHLHAVHFIDAADGGYALAAARLKAKIKANT